MADIINIIKKLSTYTQIDFSDKESEMGLLAKKYDKNMNSIFESEELQAMKDDLQEYAKSDDNAEDLNEDEAKNFLKAILPEGLSLSDFINNTGKLAADYITNLFNNINLAGIENDKTGFIKNKLKELEGKRDFDEDFIEQLSELDAKQLDKAAQLLFVEGRTKQFSTQDIYDLARLNDDRFERAKILLNTTYGDENKEFKGWEINELVKLTDEELKQLITLCNTKEILDRFECVTNIAPLATLTEEQFERAKTLFNIESRGEKQFNGEEIADLSKLTEEQFERAKTLFNIENRQGQFNGTEIVELAELKSKQFERAKNLFNTTYGDENKEFYGYQIAQLAQLTDKQLERAMTLLNTKDIFEIFDSVGEIAELAKLRYSQFERTKSLFGKRIGDEKLSGYKIVQLAGLNDEQLERAKTLFDYFDEEKNFNCFDISFIAKLPKDKFEQAKNFINIEGRKKQLNGAEISMLAKMLNDEQLKNAKNFLYIENREEQFDSNEIAALSSLKDEQLERAKSLLFIKGREKQFSGGEICMLASLPEDKYERIKDFIYVESRKGNQLNGAEITALAKLSDDELKQAKELVYIESREEQQFDGAEITVLAKLSKRDLKRAQTLINNPNKRFNGINIADMTQFSIKEYKQAKEVIYVESRGEQQFDGAGIVALAKLSKEEFERAKTLFNVESRGENQFDGAGIVALAKLSKEEFERAKTLFNVENRGKNQFYGADIAQLAKLSEDEFERAKTLFNVENRGENQFNGYDIAQLAKLSKEEFERAKTLFNVENRGKKRFNATDIVTLAKLSEDEFERAKTLFNLHDRDTQLSADTIAKLVKLPEDKYAQAEKLLYLEERELNYAEEITMLAELTDDEISSISDYISDIHFNSYNLTLIAKNNCEELKQYLDENPNPEIAYTAGNCIKFQNENQFYTYDKTGLIETGEVQKVPDDENIKNGTLTTYINTKLNVKHEVLEGEIPNTKDIKTVIEETLTFYNNDGDVIRTVTMKRNPVNGTLNVSETDKDGNQIPIQWESIDPHTGANITERHLISPEGVKTDFFCEENDGLKITDYVITDKSGNELINVHQTFEQKSDNIFVSSINTTGNPEDTQIYKIKYTKDGKVKISDKKNKKTTVIDLKKYIHDEKSMENLLPIIKQLPAQVLLEFEEKPLTMAYMEQVPHNGFWSPMSNTLIMGNFDGMTDQYNTLLAVLTHELGHYLDLYNTSETSSTIDIMNTFNTTDSKFANNPEVIAIFKEEFNAFIEKTTTAQQQYIDYFTSPVWQGQAKERVAETHSLLYSKEGSMVSTRRLYLAEFFPRTIAAIMKLLLEEEEIKSIKV